MWNFANIFCDSWYPYIIIEFWFKFLSLVPIYWQSSDLEKLVPKLHLAFHAYMIWSIFLQYVRAIYRMALFTINAFFINKIYPFWMRRQFSVSSSLHTNSKKVFLFAFLCLNWNFLAFLMKQRVKLLPITSHEEGTTRKLWILQKNTRQSRASKFIFSLFPRTVLV